MRFSMTSFLKRSFQLSAILLLFFSYTSGAQEIQIHLKIINEKKEPVPFASVNILNRQDSTRQLNKIADSLGKADFKLEKDSRYLIRISSVDYQYKESPISISGSKNTYTLTLEPLPKTLNTVTITSSKPLMRQEDDKTIVDP
ncbi:MAG: hypothetical protein JST10_01530, partial [Bacteroidetes bacterium]|nr:hypothetical protein [Bacteroidota bacterium]